jgi:hypothetical protein
MTLLNLQKFLEEVMCACHEAGACAARAALMINARRSLRTMRKSNTSLRWRAMNGDEDVPL